MPDSSIMLALCALLKISANDLLSGEIVTMENYNKKMEENLLEMIRQKEQADKRMLSLEIVIGVLSSTILFSLIFLASFLEMEAWLRILLIVFGFVLFIIGIMYAVKIEQVAGYYECAKCRNRYVPTFKSVFFAMHVNRTRYMKCPKCHQKSWNKKVLSKE